MGSQRWIAGLIGVVAVAAPATAAAAPCERSVARAVPQPTAEQLAAAGLDRLPVASPTRRLDLVAPPFSNPTNVSNPLFPIANLRSAVLNGHVDRKPLKIETTLLPGTRVIQWSPGQCVETLVSQFVSYEAGRIKEVALDFYAQADDGSVWYFGEDVFNYERGRLADRGGSWLAGKDGPAAMIMPAAPKVGDVYRPENIPGLVFEEVTVKGIGRSVRGPHGPVAGAIVARELHDDGSREDKVFAPGYGEFSTGSRNELEALAVAAPTDALAGPPAPALERLYRGALRGRSARRLAADWRTVRGGGVPPRLVTPMRRSLARVTRGRDRRHGALDVADAALDLILRHRPVDRDRFALWTRRLALHAAARDRAAVLADVAVLEWIRERISADLAPVARAGLDDRLNLLREQAADGEFKAAARTARALRKVVA